MTTGTQAVEPYGPAFQLDPYPVLARLREAGPLTRMTHPAVGPAWLVIRHDAVRRLVGDPGLLKPMEEGDADSLNSPPPVHTRLRRLVQQAFTQHRIAGLRRYVESRTGRILDGIAERGRADLITELANPMPVAVICHLLGVPERDLPEVAARTIGGFLEGEDEQRRQRAWTLAHDYITGLIADKRREPGEDLVSALIDDHDDGDRLTADELSRMIMTLLVNGSITTTNLIGTGLHLLLEHPAQLAALRADPGLIGPAVEEMLRFETPIGGVVWTAHRDLDVQGATIRAGEHLMTSLQGANRDPRRFTDPDTFDITRDPNPHLAFSHGIHHCLGAALARLEATIAIDATVRRFPALRIDGEVRRRASFVVRGLLELPVATGRAG